MADIRQTPVANYPAYYGSGLLKALNEAASKPFGYENDPVRALTNLLGIPAATKTLENIAYGMPNVIGTNMATQLRPEAKETVGNLLPMAPGVAKLTTRGLIAGGEYLAPKAGQMAEQYAVNTGLLAPLTAYHGSPHLVNKFDIAKIGTGEGSQAYGHGMYYAENMPTAKQFSLLGSSPGLRQGSSVANEQAKLDAAVILNAKKFTSGNVSDLANLITKHPTAFANPEKMLTRINEYVGNKPPGYLYKVDIPDKAAKTFLDWDNPISSNQQGIKALQKINKKYNFEYDNSFTGGDLYKALTVDFIRTGKATNEKEAQKLVSGELNKLGIKGIQHIDPNARDFKNYVVFDPSTVKILERNNKPIVQKQGGLLGTEAAPAVPQTMYHGTASDIQAFRPGNTVYVTPSPKFAESYAGTQSPNIMPLQANVTKPFNYESAADIQKLAETYKKIHGEDLFAKKTISSAGGEMKLSQLDKNPISQRLKSGDWTIIEDKKVQEAIKKAGFDAFYIEEGGVKNLGVYDPTKLKSVFSPSVNPPGLLGAKAKKVKK